jgi:hypothetical protein
MFIILTEGISFLLYNRQHEDGTNPIFCTVDGNPGTNSDFLEQANFVLRTCDRNFIFGRVFLLQAMSSRNVLTEIPVGAPVPAFNTRRMMQNAANIIRSLIVGRHLRVESHAPRDFRLVSLPPQDPVRSDLTCLNVSITSNADLIDLARCTLNLIYAQQQYGCVYQPRHLIIRGAAEDCADLHAHYLDRRIHDIPIVIDEFSSHLKTLLTILSSEGPQTLESALTSCILYGKRACDIFPDVLRTNNILSELPAIIDSMREYLRALSSPGTFQGYTLSEQNNFSWHRQIYVLWRTVSSIKANRFTGDQLSDIILSEALIILSAHGTAGSSRR